MTNCAKLSWLLTLFTTQLLADTFVLPTPNRALFTSGGEAKYFTPTPGRTWAAGTFGCVRTDGSQLHEGLDIKYTKRDKSGEPTDDIYAAAAGRVVYLNGNSGLSNYGRYIVLQHAIDGMPIFTTYAHLRRFAPGLKTGQQVRQGQTIGTMGRSTNTRSAIGKDRAHLHFEIGLRLNDRFTTWHNATYKGERNDHGNWNGRNFSGLDPWHILLQQKKLGIKFSLLETLRSQTELCRVVVRDTQFSWIRDYTPLIRRNPVADREGVAGYEVVVNAFGVPFLMIPRAGSEIGSGPKVQLRSVNEKEQLANPCKKLVIKRGGSWQLTNAGSQFFELLRY
jgi:murein DD-endopeptidase MepM/ murein hydrolase activator NlpD